VAVDEAAAPGWTAFMDAQPEARLIGVTGAGRLYEMPASPFPRQATVGAPIAAVNRHSGAEWLQVDLGGVRTVRAIDVVTRGHYLLLRATVRAETSLDGTTWTPAAEEPSGGLAFRGVLADPRGVPVRLVLPDPGARYLRVNTPAFGPGAITIYGP
jgi:hypothetical protein